METFLIIAGIYSAIAYVAGFGLFLGFRPLREIGLANVALFLLSPIVMPPVVGLMIILGIVSW